MLIINCDVDGVLYDFNREITLHAEERFERQLPAATSWSIWEDWGVTREVWWDLFGDAIRDGVFLHGDAVEFGKGINAIKQWSEDGHRVRLVTSKGGTTNQLIAIAQRDCTSWLEQQGILPFVEVCFTGGDKSGYLADVVIDDHPNLKWAQESARNLLLAQPWNANRAPVTYLHEREDYHLRGGADTQVHRIKDWEGLIHQVEIFNEVSA